MTGEGAEGGGHGGQFAELLGDDDGEDAFADVADQRECGGELVAGAQNVRRADIARADLANVA
jgi:hypothetical protein